MGSVSIQVWQFACSAVLGMIFEAAGALVALGMRKAGKKVPRTVKPVDADFAEKKSL